MQGDKPKSMGELQDRLAKLQDEYRQLDHELHKTNHVLLMSAVERAANDKLEDVSWAWQRKSDVITAQMQELRTEIDALIPSADVFNYVGERLYFALLEKYPINKATKLVQGYFPYTSWNYPIPAEFNAFSVASSDPMPPAHFKTGRADFERWTDGQHLYQLAFASEINTVFAHDEKRAR